MRVLDPALKAELFDRDRRIQALLERLGQRLLDAGYTFTDEERQAFDRISARLDADIKAMA